MLLVDHRKPELLVGDLLLENCVRADEDVDRSVGESDEDAVAGPPLLAPGKDGDSNPYAVELV